MTTKSRSAAAASVTTAPQFHFRLSLCFSCLVFVLARSFVNGEEFPCPAGWTSFGNGECFLVSEHLTTWLLARAYCLQQGANLVSFSNTTEETLLTEYINASNDQVEGFWIGLNDLNMPSIFEWSDANPLTFTKWSQEVPKWNADNATGNCVSLNHEMQWEIQNCTSEFGFICRMKDDSRAAILKEPLKCQEGMHSFRDSCYWTVSGESWASAGQWCESEGGHLVTVEDGFENIFIYTMLVHNEHKIHWLGLNVSQDTQRLTWVTGEEVQYSNWNSAPEFTPGQCGTMVRFGKWVLQACNYQYASAVCETRATPPPPTTQVTITLSPPEECPPGWIFIRDNCYLVQSKQLFTWEQARNECLSLGGDLAHFVSKEEEVTAMTSLVIQSDEQQAKALFDAPSSSLSQSLWIGLQIKILPSPGTYPLTTVIALLWTDGSSPSYDNWHSDPNTSSSDLCILLPLAILRPQWNERPCDTKAGYICRKGANVGHRSAVRDCSVVPCLSPTSPSDPDAGVPPPPPPANVPPTTTASITTTASTTPSTTTTTARAPGGVCPTDWDVFGSKCFSYIDQPQDWKTARAVCQDLGPGHDLPSIHSPGEQAFFVTQMNKYRTQEAWIGLNDLTNPGRYEWSDGSPLDFTHWSKQEIPDQSAFDRQAQDENCVIMTAVSSDFDEWDVRPCQSVNGFFCQLTLENEEGIAEMPGKPPVGEFAPPPVDTQSAGTVTSSTPNIWPQVPPLQPGPNSDHSDSETAWTSSTSPPGPSDVLGQEPEAPALSDLPASQSAILGSIEQPVPTDPADPVWMDEPGDDMSLIKCDNPENRPMTSGTIAGIVLGCLLGSGVIASILIYLYHHHVASGIIRREKLSFDNALYNPSADQIQLNTNEVTSTTPA